MAPVAAAALHTSNATQRADALLAACASQQQQPYPSAACNSLAATVLSGVNNLAARAGMVCAALGACSATTNCTALAATLLSTGAEPSSANRTLLGALDLCAAEGVVGGTPTSLPSATRGSGACRSAAECAAGAMCEITSPSPPRECECVTGRDVCYSLGTCTRYCELPATAAALLRLNAGAAACTPPGSATPGAATEAAGSCGAGEACSAVAGCQRWACDEGSQRLVAVACAGLCQPLQLGLVSAALAADGRSISVVLSSAAAAIVDVPCSSVLDAAISAAVGGARALCSADGAQLSVRLEAGATLQAGQPLVLQGPAEGGALVGRLDATQRFNGSVTVSPCSPCAAPQAVLSGPAQLTLPCAGGSSLLPQAEGEAAAVFDASLSTDPAGRPLAGVVWSLAAGYGSEASRAVLAAAVERTNAAARVSTRLVLSLTAAEVAALEDAPEYRLQVAVRSWLGTAATATASFSKASSSPAPAVQVAGPAAQTFRISTGVRLSAEAGAACRGKSLEWRWSSPSAWPGLASAATGQALYLPGPLPAVHGQGITLQVAARYAGDPDSATAAAEVQLTAIGSAPVALLTGPSGDTADNIVLALNATGSRDPDTSLSLQRLSFAWDCRREDYPAPCFTGAEQGDRSSAAGMWVIPAGLLAAGTWHTLSVTVSKEVAEGAAPLQASASLRIRPRPSAQPFPRGSLSRQCSAAGCTGPHSTDRGLTLALLLDQAFRSATVTWSSPEAAAVAALAAASSATDASVPVGTHTLTIPASALPANRDAITVAASLTLNGVTGAASLTVALNSAPYCTLNPSDPSACLTADVLSATFPDAAVVLRARGWADGQDTALRYEFGTRDPRVGGGNADAVRQLGSAASARLVGLAVGSTALYVCALDSQGSRTCGAVNVTVQPAAAGFDAASALQAVDVLALTEANDGRALLAAASRAAQIMSSVAAAAAAEANGATAGTASASEAAVSQSVLLVGAILGGTDMQDAEQAAQAVAAIASLAASAAPLLSESAKDIMLAAAKAATAARLSGTGSADGTQEPLGEDFVTQLCRLLGAALPTADSAATSGSGGSAKAAKVAKAATAAEAAAQARLLDMLQVTGQLGAALGRQAVPGQGCRTAGDGGVYIAAAASSGADGTLLLTAGEVGGGGGAVRRRGRALAAAGGAVTAAVGSGAEVQLVSGAAAAASGGPYSVSVQYAPSAAAGLAAAVSSLLPAGAALLGGLTTVSWTGGSGSGAAPPSLSLDAGASYLLLRIPAPGFASGKVTACLLYDAAANELTGDLPGLQTSAAGTAAASFVSYDSATGRVTCRAAAFGSYALVQGLAPPVPTAEVVSPATLALPSPPPPPAFELKVLSVSFAVNASSLATPAAAGAFEAAVRQAIASALQVPVSDVRVASLALPSASSPDTVLVVLEVRLPAGPAAADRLTAFSATPLAAFPPDFVSRFGVTAVVARLGVQQAGTPVGGGAAGSASSGGGGGPPVAAIVGGAVGGGVALVAAAAAALIALRRRRNRVQARAADGGGAPTVIRVVSQSSRRA